MPVSLYIPCVNHMSFYTISPSAIQTDLFHPLGINIVPLAETVRKKPVGYARAAHIPNPLYRKALGNLCFAGLLKHFNPDEYTRILTAPILQNLSIRIKLSPRCTSIKCRPVNDLFNALHLRRHHHRMGEIHGLKRFLKTHVD